jgi:tetratricopeptide (TPR) repeat protein
MSRIFLSHSSKDNFEALALRNWLAIEGWDDVFLDLDPNRGIAAGERWERSLHAAANRCEAVIFLVSGNWLASGWCLKEYWLARQLNKKLFAVIIDPTTGMTDLPPELSGTWQAVNLSAGQDGRMLPATLPDAHEERHVVYSVDGLRRLRNGLAKAGLDPTFFAWPPVDDPQRAPYRGLRSLDAADAGVFFGRDAPIVEALDRLRGLRSAAPPRLLALLGASGAGKSSFLRAGLWPRLARDDANFLPLSVIRPERAALYGETGLLGALEKALPTFGRARLRDAIAGGAQGVRPLLESLVRAALTRTLAESPDARAPLIVIAIDQAEELFRDQPSDEGNALLGLLRDLAMEEAPSIAVLFAIRSDAYDELERAKPLEGLPQSTLPLLPMPRGAYMEVIEGPVRRFVAAGGTLSIDSRLTQALLSDLEDGGGSDALPLLAFTLEQLFLEYGAAGAMRHPDYVAFGGLRGAIDKAVARAFARADVDARIPREPKMREALLRRGLIPWLAGIDPDSRTPRRNIARRADIPEEARPLIDLLVEERLLTTDTKLERDGEGHEARVATIEPAHEALLRQWGSLQGWLTEDLGRLATLEGVKRGARDWDANARADAWLAHRGQRLVEATTLREERPDIAARFDPVDRLYLDACAAAEATELGRRAKRRRWTIAAVAVVVSGLSAAAVVSWYQWRALGQNQLEAKLIEYREAVKLAERDTLAKGPRPSDKPLQDIRKAFALGDEVKQMRGAPPDTADADAARLYEYAAINSAEIGDPAGANRYLAMRKDLLARSPELAKKVGSLVAMDPNILTVLDLQMELEIANLGLKDDIEQDSVEIVVMHNYESLFTVLNEVSPRAANYDWMSFLQYAQARNYEYQRNFIDAQKYWEARAQTARDRLKWARQNNTLLIERDRKRLVLDAAQDVVQTQNDVTDFRERRQDFAGAVASARQALQAFADNPELSDEASLRWDTRVDLGEALLKSGQPDLARDERVAAADEFVGVGNRKIVQAELELAMHWRRIGNFHASQKDSGRAASAYSEALHLVRPLADGDNDARKQLTETLGAYGEFESQMKRFPDALSALQERIKQTRAAAAADGADSKAALADSLEEFGRVELDAGDAAAAIAPFQEAQTIHRTILNSLGVNQQDIDAWRTLVAQSDTLLKSGDIAKALEVALQAANLTAAAVSKNDDRIKVMRLLALNLDATASSQDKLQNYIAVNSAYSACQEIFQERLDDLNANIDGRELFSNLIARLRTADTKAHDGMDALASPVLQKNLELMLDRRKIADILAADKKERAKTVDDLAVLHKEAGDFKYRQKDYTGALAEFQERLKSLRELPSEEDAARARLTSTLQDVGDALEQLGRWPEALDSNREALAITEKRTESAPEDAEKQGDLARALSFVGWDLLKLKRLDESLPLYEKSLSIRRELAKSAPDDSKASGVVRETAEDVGGLAYDFVLAREFEQALRASDSAIAAAPGLLWLQTNRAHALMFLGRIAEAKAIYLAHRGEKDGDKASDNERTWDGDLKSDFAEFRKSAMSAPLMDEIEAALAAPVNQDAPGTR